MENRLLNGFNYFWNLSPSKFTKKDVLALHAWQKMLKESVVKVDEPLTQENLLTAAEMIFGKARN